MAAAGEDGSTGRGMGPAVCLGSAPTATHSLAKLLRFFAFAKDGYGRCDPIAKSADRSTKMREPPWLRVVDWPNFTRIGLHNAFVPLGP